MNTPGVNMVTRIPAEVGPELHRLREATDRVIGSIFFGTLLKTMRDSELRGMYGHGGRGEDVFAAQLHGILAERMGAAMQGGLSEVLYERLQPQQQRISAQQPVG